MEPWILLQILFQPAMLHQWAVALFAEALTFQKKIAPIFNYGFPTNLARITEKLKTMLRSLRSCVRFTLGLYLRMSSEGLDKNFHTELVQTEMEEFSNHLTKILPILKFVTSEEASGIIGAIKDLCLEELNKGGEVNPPQVVIQTTVELQMPMYDFWFWTKQCDIEEVFVGAKSDQIMCNSELVNYVNGQFYCSKSRCTWTKALKKLVDEKIIQTDGCLKGVDREIIMAALENRAEFYTIYCFHYRHYFGKH